METHTSIMGTTLRDYLKVLFKHKAVIITPVIVSMLVVFIGLNLYTPTYTAQVKMILAGSKLSVTPYYKEFFPGQIGGLLGQERVMIESSTVIARTVSVLGLHNLPLDYQMRFSSGLKRLLIEYKVEKLKRRLEKLPPEKKQAFLFNGAVGNLKRMVTVAPGGGTNMFTIEVSDFSPTGAIVIANVLSRVYIIYDFEQQLAELLLQYGEKYPLTLQVKNKIEELQKYLDGRPLPDIEAIGPARIKIIEQAKEATPVIRYNKRSILTLTFFLSVILGVMFAFGFEYLNQTLKSPQDIEKYLNVPFLGSIPKRKSKDKLLIEDANPATSYTQFYQNLSEQLHLLINDKNLRSFLIVDAESFPDTSAAVIANIGKCFARREDYKVLIIDANLRNPLVSKIFNILSTPGLTDVLEGKILFEDVVQNLGSNLTVLTAGQTIFNPSTLLGSSKMADLLNIAKEKYKIIFLTCADLKNFTDALILSSIIDGIVLVVNEGKTRRQVAKAAIAPLEQRKVNLIGAILNNRTFVLPKIIYDRT